MSTTTIDQKRIFELNVNKAGGIQMTCYLLCRTDKRWVNSECKHQIQVKRPFVMTERVTRKYNSIYRHQRTDCEYINNALDTLETEVRGVMANNTMTLAGKRADIQLIVRQCIEQIAEHETTN